MNTTGNTAAAAVRLEWFKTMTTEKAADAAAALFTAKIANRLQMSNSGFPDSSARATAVSPEFMTNQMAVMAVSGTIRDAIGTCSEASGCPPVIAKNACVARYIESAGPQALKSSLMRL